MYRQETKKTDPVVYVQEIHVIEVILLMVDTKNTTLETASNVACVKTKRKNVIKAKFFIL
jgi:hypothetical protein